MDIDLISLDISVLFSAGLYNPSGNFYAFHSTAKYLKYAKRSMLVFSLIVLKVSITDGCMMNLVLIRNMHHIDGFTLKCLDAP